MVTKRKVSKKLPDSYHWYPTSTIQACLRIWMILHSHASNSWIGAKVTLRSMLFFFVTTLITLIWMRRDRCHMEKPSKVQKEIFTHTLFMERRFPKVSAGTYWEEIEFTITLRSGTQWQQNVIVLICNLIISKESLASRRLRRWIRDLKIQSAQCTRFGA